MTTRTTRASAEDGFASDAANARATAARKRRTSGTRDDFTTYASQEESRGIYSLRSAVLGSTRAARAAGTKHAARVTPPRSTHTPASVARSFGATPNSSDWRYRVSANEPA